MEGDSPIRGEPGGVAHDLRRHRERRAGGERDLDERTVSPLVEGVDHPLAVGEDRVAVLHHRLRRKAAVPDGQVHGAAGEGHPDPEVAGGCGLDVDRALQARREDVVVVGGGGAPREQQLGESEPGRGVEPVRSQSRPHRIEGLQPVEQLLAEGRTVGAGQGLVEVVVGVDESRQHHVPGRVEDAIAGRGRNRSGREALRDAVPVDDETARRVLVRQDGERLADPGPHDSAPRVRPAPDRVQSGAGGVTRPGCGRAPTG